MAATKAVSKAEVEHVARVLCSASGGEWRAPPFNHLHTDSLNNHWRYKAAKVLEAIDGLNTLEETRKA